MTSDIGVLKGRSEGVGRLGDLSSNRGRTSVGIGNDHGINPREEVIEVLGNCPVGPRIGVGRCAKGRREVDAAIVATKTRNIGICEG